MQVFLSCHYAGKDLMVQLEKGEPWKKVFGPIPIYLNSASSNHNSHSLLWENAKQQVYIYVCTIYYYMNSAISFKAI